MAKTVAQAILEARDALDDPAPGRFKDPQLRRWLNEAQRDIARRVPWFRLEATESAVAGTQTYDAPVTAVMIHDIRYETTGSDRPYPLDYMPQANVARQMGPMLTTSRGIPSVFWTGGFPGALTFSVAPIPSSAGTFTIFYYAIPADYTDYSNDDETDSILVPEGFESAVVHYMVYSAKASAGKADWVQWKQMYESTLTGLEEITDTDFTDQLGGILGGSSPSFSPGYLYGSEDW